MRGLIQSRVKFIGQKFPIAAMVDAGAVLSLPRSLNSESIFMRGYGVVIALNEQVVHLARRLVGAVQSVINSRRTSFLAGDATAAPRDLAFRQATQSASAEVAVVVVDDALRIRELSSGVEKLFGRASSNFVDKPLAALIEPSQAKSLYVLLRDALEPGEAPPFVVEFSIRNIDGRTLDLEASCARTETAGKRVCILAVRDVSKLKLAEHRVAELTTSLQRAYTDFEKFAYVAAHDLRAPLRVIENATQWLEEDLEAHLNESAHEDFALIKNRIERMQTHLDLLLSYARLGREVDTKGLIDGREFVATLSADIALPDGFSLDATDAFLDCKEFSIPLRRVLLSLLQNAIEHHDRSVGRIVVDVQSEPEHHRFHVVDDGPGIAPAYREKVFEMFQSLKSKDHSESAGMGLTLARRRVEVAGGSIEISAKQRRGVTFTVVWPRNGNRQELW